MENQIVSNNSVNSISSIPQEASKSVLILILGILSCCLLGLISGIPAWILGVSERKKISLGIIPIAEKTTATIGMVLGIIGTFLSIIFIAIFITAFSTRLSVLKSASMVANRDAITADGTNIMSLAQQYYHKSITENGGTDSFEGFVIPQYLEKTENGSYKILIKNKDLLIIDCVGKELGRDGINPVKVVFEVEPERISNCRIVN